MRLPEIREQRRIGRVLAAADGAFDRWRAASEQNQVVRDRFLRQMLSYGPRLPAALPASDMDPLRWQLRPIGSLCSMSNGFPFRTSDRSESGLPIIRIRNLNGCRAFRFFGGLPAPGWTVEAGDLLFSWAGVKGSSFGPCLWPGPRGVLNQHIFLVRPNKGIAKEWLFETLKLVTHEIEEKARGFKSDLQHVRKSEVTDQLVRVPPYEIQRRIAALSSASLAIESAERKSLEVLDRLKTGLLYELLDGRTVRSRCRPDPLGKPDI